MKDTDILVKLNQSIVAAKSSLDAVEKWTKTLAEKNGVEKTKVEAQALVDAEVTAAQAAWDLLSEAEQSMHNRPGPITLP